MGNGNYLTILNLSELNHSQGRPQRIIIIILDDVFPSLLQNQLEYNSKLFFNNKLYIIYYLLDDVHYCILSYHTCCYSCLMISKIVVWLTFAAVSVSSSVSSGLY